MSSPARRRAPPIDRTVLITGAFGFTGGAIRRRLQARGLALRTLTDHAPADPGEVRVFPHAFDDPGELARSLEGVDTLYNTYWVRFARGSVTYERAVENSVRLFEAARAAGVGRLVHVSIANPSPDSALPYYRGKAQVESALIRSGLSYAIVRPTVLFGDAGLLINNIAWLLRRLPLFVIPGRGDYRIQPAHVDDLAALAIECGDRTDDLVLDAVGPETYRYADLVDMLRETVKSRARIVSLPPGLALGLGRLLGWLLRDVLITREEIVGLCDDLLVSRGPPTCKTSLHDWLLRNREQVGARYLSELARHYRRPAAAQ